MRRQGWETLPCTCTYTHYFTCIYRSIYRTWIHTLTLSETNETLDTHTEWHSDLKMKGIMAAAERYIFETMKYINAVDSRHTHTHTCTQHFSPLTLTMDAHIRRPSPLRPASLDPTDSLQSALEARGSSLPLEPESDIVIWHWQWQWNWQRPLLPGRTKHVKGQDPPLSHCSDCWCCFKRGLCTGKLFLWLLL